MWLIIGYGNPLRGDDGAGPALAELLRQNLPAGLASVLTVHQLTPELSLALLEPQIRGVLFLDTRRDQPADVQITPVSIPSPVTSNCGHHLTPELLLDCADQLYGCRRPGWLLTLRGVDFNFREGLSLATTVALEAALTRCQEFLLNTPLAAPDMTANARS